MEARPEGQRFAFFAFRVPRSAFYASRSALSCWGRGTSLASYTYFSTWHAPHCARSVWLARLGLIMESTYACKYGGQYSAVLYLAAVKN